MSKIKNELNIDLDVYVIIDDDFQYKKKKAFIKDGVRTSRIGKGKEMDYEPFDVGDTIQKSFMVRFEMDKEPKKNGFLGVKLALAGKKLTQPFSNIKGLSIPHHFAYYKKGNIFYAEVHYMIEDLIKALKKDEKISDIDASEKIKQVIMQDVDPNIKHPPGGG